MSASNSPLAAAFQRAGYVPAGDRLMARAIEAWGKFPGADQAVRRRSFIAEILHGEMTWRLMDTHNAPGVTVALDGLLRTAAAVIRAQAPKNAAGGDVSSASDGGQILDGTHAAVAPVAYPLPASERALGRSGAGHVARDTHVDTARPAPSRQQQQDAQSAAARTRIAVLTRITALDQIIVNGRKLGDVTPPEALSYASRHEREARFIRMITANLPQDRTIRSMVDAGTVDEYWKRAGESA